MPDHATSDLEVKEPEEQEQLKQELKDLVKLHPEIGSCYFVASWSDPRKEPFRFWSTKNLNAIATSQMLAVFLKTVQTMSMQLLGDNVRLRGVMDQYEKELESETGK